MPWDRNDAAAPIATAWVYLRDDMKHLAKGEYDADDHNIGVAHVEFHDGTTKLLFAYSDSSKMNKKFKDFYEIPPTSEYEDNFNLSQMLRAHTEPKLLNYILNNFSQGVMCFTHVTLATARDPCTSCSKVITRFNKMHPGKITVYGFNAQYNDGQPNLSGTPYG
jgi:hypothetical protein